LAADADEQGKGSDDADDLNSLGPEPNEVVESAPDDAIDAGALAALSVAPTRASREGRESGPDEGRLDLGAARASMQGERQGVAPGTFRGRVYTTSNESEPLRVSASYRTRRSEPAEPARSKIPRWALPLAVGVGLGVAVTALTAPERDSESETTLNGAAERRPATRPQRVFSPTGTGEPLEAAASPDAPKVQPFAEHLGVQAVAPTASPPTAAPVAAPGAPLGDPGGAQPAVPGGTAPLASNGAQPASAAPGSPPTATQALGAQPAPAAQAGSQPTTAETGAPRPAAQVGAPAGSQPMAAATGVAAQPGARTVSQSTAAQPVVPRAAVVNPGGPVIAQPAGQLKTQLSAAAPKGAPAGSLPRSSPAVVAARAEASSAPETDEARLAGAAVRGSEGNSLDQMLDKAFDKPKQAPASSAANVASAPRPADPDGVPPAPSRDDVIKAMSVLVPAIRGCAQGASGLATAGIVVRNDGRVESAVVSGAPFQGTASGRCMEGVVRRARFPRFKQPTFRVQFPFSIQ
jgi:hypothetical protein